MRIWPWSHIADLELELATERACIRGISADYATMQTQLDQMNNKLNRINTQVSSITPGLGRAIAKLDTQFARDPQSPAMQAESDRISAEAIRRLEAEAAARAPYNHDLGDK